MTKKRWILSGKMCNRETEWQSNKKKKKKLCLEVVLKIIETEAVFYQDRNKQWMKHYFFQNFRFVQKVLKLKLYLPRQKWTMNEIIISFKT